MEVLIIQKEAFEEMAAKFCRFTERVDAILAKQGGKSLNAWMDNQEVCRQLNKSADSLTSVREPYRRCATTARWLIRKSTTRCFTSRRT